MSYEYVIVLPSIYRIYSRLLREPKMSPYWIILNIIYSCINIKWFVVTVICNRILSLEMIEMILTKNSYCRLSERDSMIIFNRELKSCFESNISNELEQIVFFHFNIRNSSIPKQIFFNQIKTRYQFTSYINKISCLEFKLIWLSDRYWKCLTSICQVPNIEVSPNYLKSKVSLQ